MGDKLLSELGFPEWTEATGRQSVADLYKPRGRCGIYVLGFENGEQYVGQAVDVVRRFTQHCKTHADIAQITFLRVPKPELNAFETRCIHELEGHGVRLRNISQMSVVQGERDIDLVVTPEEQAAWLDDAAAIADSQIHVQDDSLRQRLEHRLRQLQALPDADEALYLLGLYLTAVIPAPRRTELTFWMVSCLPYGVKGNDNILFRLSLNMQEVFTVWEDSEGLGASFHLARSPFEEEFGPDWQKTLQDGGIGFTDHAYKPGGHDQFQIIAYGTNDIADLICDQTAGKAMALLNMRLMRKGPTYYGTSHCLALVDTALETYQRMEKEALEQT